MHSVSKRNIYTYPTCPSSIVRWMASMNIDDAFQQVAVSICKWQLAYANGSQLMQVLPDLYRTFSRGSLLSYLYPTSEQDSQCLLIILKPPQYKLTTALSNMTLYILNAHFVSGMSSSSHPSRTFFGILTKKTATNAAKPHMPIPR